MRFKNSWKDNYIFHEISCLINDVDPEWLPPAFWGLEDIPQTAIHMDLTSSYPITYDAIMGNIND